MLKAVFELQGVSDLMFGKHVPEGKLDNETHEQREERLWKEKIWCNGDGQCYVSPFAITNGLVSGAEWLKRKVPGEGQATFTKRFRSGLNPGNNVLLFKSDGKPILVDDVQPVPLFVPSDGQHGGKKRVFRIFPTVHEWVAKGEVFIFDGKITEEVFKDHFIAMGRFVGIGPMRVQNGGINGRFSVVSLAFEPLEA
jgi:hypothetical protein